MTEHYKEIARLREQLGFLGYEFLTWLFLLLDREAAREEVAELTSKLFTNTKVSLVLGNRLVSCLLNHKEQKTTITTPILEDSHEVFASLKNGHVLESLSLNVLLGDISVSFSLHAQDFAITQIKIKNDFLDQAPEDGEDLSEADQNREEIFLRTGIMDDLERIIDALFTHFLRTRADGHAFFSEQKTMQNQVEMRLKDYLNPKRPGQHDDMLSLNAR